MLIVLTSEQDLQNEAELINSLFNSGLAILHLRKPSFDIEGYRNLLCEIESKYHKAIMVHEHHSLCLDFDLKGVHLQEQPRLDLGNDLTKYVKEFKSKNYLVSSSFHEPTDLENCRVNFDYHLLSPVFSSISKKGYEGRGFDVNHIDKVIIGMGGINNKTLAKTFRLGFKGVGVLGGIWNTNTPIESFIELKNEYESVLA